MSPIRRQIHEVVNDVGRRPYYPEQNECYYRKEECRRIIELVGKKKRHKEDYVFRPLVHTKRPQPVPITAPRFAEDAGDLKTSDAQFVLNTPFVIHDESRSSPPPKRHIGKRIPQIVKHGADLVLDPGQLTFTL